MHKFVLDGISDNMSALGQDGKFGAISIAYPTTWVIIMSSYYQNHIPYKTTKHLTVHS